MILICLEFAAAAFVLEINFRLNKL